MKKILLSVLNKGLLLFTVFTLVVSMTGLVSVSRVIAQEADPGQSVVDQTPPADETPADEPTDDPGNEKLSNLNFPLGIGPCGLLDIACPPPSSTVTVTIVKYVDGERANNTNADSTSFPMHATWNDPEGIGSSEGDFNLDSGNSYQAETSEMTNGADYSVVENIPTFCDGNDFSRLGYKIGDSEQDALNSPVVQDATLTDIPNDKFILVMNHDCSSPEEVIVTIVKYLNGERATAESASSTSFSMTSTWDADNLNNGDETSGNFPLDPNGYNSEGTPYMAVTSYMTNGADYSVVENDVPAVCDDGLYALDGYRVGDDEASAFAASNTETAELTNIHNNKFILVMNHDCSNNPPPCDFNDLQTIVSDSDTQVDGHDAVAVTPHPAWTTISGATWIWKEALDLNGSSPAPDTRVLSRDFNLTGTPLDSTLEIAADNYYSVLVNGSPLDTGTSATDLDNFSAADTWNIPAANLQTGSNLLQFTVTNPLDNPAGGTFGDPNPAGLLFKVTANADGCNPVEPEFVKVHIYKYLGNSDSSSQVPNDAGLDPFPMHAAWHALNLDGGLPAEADYVLGNNHGGAPLKYSADTSPMQTPVISYHTYEKTTDDDPGSQVVPTNAEVCPDGKYRLLGYKSGDSLSEAETAPIADSPTYTNFSNDKYLIVLNQECDEGGGGEGQGTLTIVKHSIGGDDSFYFEVSATSTEPENIDQNQDVNLHTVDGYATSSDILLDPGTYDVTEGYNFSGNWDLTNVTCEYDNESTGIYIPIGGEEITLGSGDHVICTFTNENNEEGPTLTIVKHAIGGNDTFHFQLSGATSSSTINVTTEEDGYGNSGVIELNEGTTTVSEINLPAGWNFLDSDCVYENESVGQPTAVGSEEIHVDNGDHVTCTFANIHDRDPNPEGPGSISGMKFDDHNGNGIKDPGEEGLENWSIFLFSSPDSENPVSEVTVTDADGNYSFDNLPVTDEFDGYIVCEVFQGDWTQTYPTTDSAEGQCPEGFGYFSEVNKSGSSDTGFDFGNQEEPNHGGGGSSGGGSSGGGTSDGQVLGASTGPDSTCSIYLHDYLRYGWTTNNPYEVTLLQMFLNDFQHAGLLLTGIFGLDTFDAVKKFQASEETRVRNPWSEANSPITDPEWPTGFVFKTTKWTINEIKCPEANGELPMLP